MHPEAQLEALRVEHDRLDDVIQREARRPGTDDLHLAELKREKLRLKDAILDMQKGSVTIN